MLSSVVRMFSSCEVEGDQRLASVVVDVYVRDSFRRSLRTQDSVLYHKHRPSKSPSLLRRDVAHRLWKMSPVVECPGILTGAVTKI